MTSSPEHSPTGHSETCAVCEGDIKAMAYKGTGVCGQICLAAWRKSHPLPEELQITKEQFAEALDQFGASSKKIDTMWKVLTGHA
jgi:hypothetical protein